MYYHNSHNSHVIISVCLRSISHAVEITFLILIILYILFQLASYMLETSARAYFIDDIDDIGYLV